MLHTLLSHPPHKIRLHCQNVPHGGRCKCRMLDTKVRNDMSFLHGTYHPSNSTSSETARLHRQPSTPPQNTTMSAKCEHQSRRQHAQRSPAMDSPNRLELSAAETVQISPRGALFALALGRSCARVAGRRGCLGGWAMHESRQMWLKECPRSDSCALETIWQSLGRSLAGRMLRLAVGVNAIEKSC